MKPTTIWISLALVVAIGLVYFPVVGHGFVEFDDGAYVAKNPMVAGGLTAEGIAWAFSNFHSGN